MAKDYDIEKADNGFVTKQDRGIGYANAHKVFTTFEELVEDMASFFSVTKIGEKYKDKAFREELSRQQNSARQDNLSCDETKEKL